MSSKARHGRKQLGMLLMGQGKPTMREDQFRPGMHRIVYSAICEAYRRYEATDPIVVGAVLGERGYLEQMGHNYLMDLMEEAMP